MNFDFSEDQRRLQEEVRRVLGDHSTSAHVRRVLEGEAAYAADTWRELAGLGALGGGPPRGQGGGGAGPPGAVPFCADGGRGGGRRTQAAVPLAGSIYMAAEAIRRAGSAAQQAAWLPRLASGEVIGTAMLAAHGEHALRAEPARLEGGRLTATFNAVPDGMAASVLVALVGDALVLVDLAGAGVSREAQASIDPTHPLARVVCAGAPVEVMAASGGAAIAAAVADGAAVLLAFEQVGGAERALYVARDYVLERRAFGRIVGGFQAVKHKLAEIYAEIELARAHAYYGAWALATGAAELPRAAAAARVAATGAYTLAAEESLHLHGGIGFTWEMDCHLHLRRARWLGQIIGTQHYWRERLASSLIEEAA